MPEIEGRSLAGNVELLATTPSRTMKLMLCEDHLVAPGLDTVASPWPGVSELQGLGGVQQFHGAGKRRWSKLGLACLAAVSSFVLAGVCISAV